MSVSIKTENKWQCTKGYLNFYLKYPFPLMNETPELFSPKRWLRQPQYVQHQSWNELTMNSV